MSTDAVPSLRLRGSLIELGALRLDARTAAQLALDLFATATQALDAELALSEARSRDLFATEEEPRRDCRD